MATNKRFLGLGFTFTAVDKGLQKKLEGINDALQGIANSVTRINAASAKTSGLSKIKAPSAAATRMAPRPSTSNTISQPKTQSMLFEDAFSKLSKDSKGFVGQIQGALGAKLGKDFSENIKKMRVELTQTGDFAGDTRKKFEKLSTELVETSQQVGKYQHMFEEVKKSFNFMQKWFHDVGNSVERFLSSVGVDLQTIIPEQFKALFGIAKSIFAPIGKGLLSLPTMLLNKVFKKETGQIQDQMLAQLKAIFEGGTKQIEKSGQMVEKLNEVSEKLGARPSGTKNTNALLEGISDNTKPQSKSMFGKIGDFLKNLGKGIFGKIGAIASLIPGFGILSKLLKPLGGLFEMLAKGIRPVLRFLGPVAEAAAGVASALFLAAAGFKFLEGFGDTIKKNWKVFQDFGESVSRFAQAVFKAYPWVGKMADVAKQAWQGLMDFGKGIMELPSKLIDMLPKGFDTVGGQIGEMIRAVIGAVVDLIKGVASHPLDVIKDSLAGWNQFGSYLGKKATELTQGATNYLNQATDALDKKTGPAGAPTPARDNLSGIIQEQTNTQSQIMTRQLDMMKSQNDMLSQLLGVTKDQNNQPIKADIKIKNSSDAQLEALAMGM